MWAFFMPNNQVFFPRVGQNFHIKKQKNARHKRIVGGKIFTSKNKKMQDIKELWAELRPQTSILHIFAASFTAFCVGATFIILILSI